MIGRRRRTRSRGFLCENLETRLVLNAATLPAIPQFIPVATAPQTLFAPESSNLTVADNPAQPQAFYRFALDGGNDLVHATFRLTPPATGPGAPTDAALAVYGSNGGMLSRADFDATPARPGEERLDVNLPGGETLVVGVFFSPGGAAADFNLNLQTSGQAINAPLAIDPVTGAQVARPVGPEDNFQTPRDVDYYPLTLTNGGASGKVTVTPTDLDVNATATLFRRLQSGDAWAPIATASNAAGGPVTLNIAPPPNQNIGDAQYLLAVAPVDFSGAGGAYGVSLSNVTLAVPGTVSLAGAVDLGTLAPTGPGTVGVSRNDSIAAAGAAKLYQFKASGDGPISVQASSSAFGPAVSVYDATGSTLIGVASRGQPGSTSLSFDGTAGAQYVLRIGDTLGTRTGSFSVQVSGVNNPTALPLSGPVTTVNNVNVAAVGGQAFRIQPDAAADVLVIEVTQNAGAGAVAPVVVVSGPNQAPVTTQAAAGQTVFLPLAVGQNSGPVDVFVSAASGTDPVRLRIGQATLPKYLTPTQLPSGKVDLSGTLNSANISQNSATFSFFSGIAYYELPAQTAADTATLTAAGSGGAIPLVAQYAEDGGRLALKSFALPTGATATMTPKIAGKRLAAIAALSLNLDGGGTTTFSVTGPPVTGVGVGMVSDPLPPHQTPPPVLSPPFTSKLNITGATLERDFDQDLFRTSLPFNLTATPGAAIVFTPQGGDFTARVTVLGPDKQTVLASGTSAAGQPLSLTISDASATSLAGQDIFFHVEPRTLSTPGTYKIGMTVNTNDPNPFLVTEPQFRFSRSILENGIGLIPFAGRGSPFVDIVQNQFGDGSAVSSFNSSQPYYASGGFSSIDVFSFWAVTPGPIIIKTVDLDRNVNTDIKLYKIVYNTSHGIDRLAEVSSVPLNIDWERSDRSHVDAQIVVNDFDLVKYTGAQGAGDDNAYGNGGGQYFVVVKNQEGTQGQYRIDVDAPSFPALAGESAIRINSYGQALGGSITQVSQGDQTINNEFVDSITNFVGYYPLQLPAQNRGPLRVTATAGAAWEWELFDSDGHAIPSLGKTGSPAIEQFDVPPGSRTVYLRTREQAGTNNNNSQFLVATPNLDTSGLAAPPLLTFGPQQVMLTTTPTGDATVLPAPTGGTPLDLRLHDTVTAAGQEKFYAFEEASGAIRVTVQADHPGDVDLQFGLYNDGALFSYNQTRTVQVGSSLQFDPLSTTIDQMTFRFASLTPTPDFSTDQSIKNRMLLYVKAVNAPTSGGNFTVTMTAPPPRQSPTRAAVSHPTRRTPASRRRRWTVPGGLACSCPAETTA